MNNIADTKINKKDDNNSNKVIIKITMIIAIIIIVIISFTGTGMKWKISGGVFGGQRKL